jgi:hypothetical protein
LEDWGTFKAVGRGYGFTQEEKFYSILETRKGSYRGNHVHPVRQYTLLLSGKASYIIYDSEKYTEIPLKVGEITTIEPKVPHIMVVEEDITTFEWWDGDFIAEPCSEVFKAFTKGKVGPEDYI